MAAYENDNTSESIDVVSSTIYDLTEKGKDWFMAFLGVIVLFAAIILVFFIAALEETKVVKASNSISGKLLNIWREQAGDEDEVLFPREKVDIIEYKKHEYYFVIEEKDEEGNISKWYWAYDSGLNFVFEDTRYYIMTGITVVLSVMVAVSNYLTTRNNEKKKDKFKSSLLYYQTKKKLVEPYTQNISEFCFDKNKEAYEMKKRDIVNSADINWEFYNSKDFDVKKIAFWQKRKLSKIRKIKVKRIYSSSLLQEHINVGLKISLLPMSENEHFTKFVIKNIFSKIFSIASSGLVIGFGFKFGNITLALLFSGIILSSWIGGILSAGFYVNEVLRYRFISKGNLLNEFYNIRHKYIEAPREDKVDNTPTIKDNLLTTKVGETNGGLIL